MNQWDALWLKFIKEQNLTTKENDRYMDNIRVFTLALKSDWRWDGDGFYFCDEWKAEDLMDGKSPTRRTAEHMAKAMSSIFINTGCSKKAETY